MEREAGTYRANSTHGASPASATKTSSERLPVKVGLSTLDAVMTREQARRYGDRNMPKDLKRVGFQTSVGRTDPEIHGGNWFRVSYGKTV
jgi:hypothetical protein